MLREIIEAIDLLDDARVDGERVRDWLGESGAEKVEVTRVEGEKGSTDFIKTTVSARNKTGPTLGIVGRLGGVGARPAQIGIVSDADGCIVALACAARLSRMASRGDGLPGDVIIATHVCPNAPTVPHDPTPFMDSPVDIGTMNKYEIDPAMEGVLSVDATKGNWVLNKRGFAITATVKDGWILRVQEALLETMRFVTGEPPVVLPITMQDITPYGNGLFHVNSILQPAVATSAPVVGVATTSAVPVAGCATGANQAPDLEMAARFCIETAKLFTAGKCQLYDREEFEKILNLYGAMGHLRTLGRN